MSSSVFDTDHAEMIHDCQLDWFGKRLATASSDRTIKVFDVSSNDNQTLLDTLSGHDGPVWQVAWSHPQFGSLLASCSYDKRVIIWKEVSAGKWSPIHEDVSHTASVNAVAWAPHTLGLMLATGSADGTVCILSCPDDKNWQVNKFQAHAGGVNAVSWAPDTPKGGLLENQQNQQAQLVCRLVTGGCDNQVSIWNQDPNTQQWRNEGGAESKNFSKGDNKHDDWVRDVAWAPSLGLPSNTIASCSEDKTVIIWTEHNGQWRKAKTLAFEHKVWKVSWSVMGNILAVSQGDNRVTLWKEAVDGEWQELRDVVASSVEEKKQE